MNFKAVIVGLLLITSSSVTIAQSTTKSTFGKGIEVKAEDESFKMKFSTRIQSLFVFDIPINADGSLGTTSSDFLVRRARLKFSGYAYNPNIEYKIELGLSNRDHGSPTPETKNSARMILDAVVKWKFAKNTSLWVGQTKLPGNRERVISSQALQFVDRSLLNSKYNIDRDMGVQLHHKWTTGNMVVKEAVAFSQGEGRNITSGNKGGYDYTGRVELLPMGNFASKGDYMSSDLAREETPKLALGVTYDYHDDAVRANGNQKSYLSEARTLKTVFADLMFKYNGISVMAEYANKQADGGSVVMTDVLTGDPTEFFYTGTGFNMQVGYLAKKNWELAGRYTTISPSVENQKDDIQMYTLGVSRYVVGHNLKVQSDISRVNEGSSKNLLFRMQLELAF